MCPALAPLRAAPPTPLMATPYPPLPIVDFSAPPPRADADAAFDPASPSPTSTTAETVLCDSCDTPIVGEPAGEGVYLWSRGGELIYEPAPLCERCALALNASALADLGPEEEEEG